MLVRDAMTVKPFTVSPDMSMPRALLEMKHRRVRRFPVMRGQKLVGIVSEQDLLEAAPSPATTLSVFELPSLLSSTTVESVMSHPVLTIDADAPLWEAAWLMRDQKVGGLPVLEEGHLVGIVTESDIFRVLTTLLGGDPEDLTVALPDQPAVREVLPVIVSHVGTALRTLIRRGNEIQLIIRVPGGPHAVAEMLSILRQISPAPLLETWPPQPVPERATTR